MPTQAVVQNKTVVNTSSAAFSSSVTSGNLLVAVVGAESDLSTVTVADTLGTIYSQVVLQNAGNTKIRVFSGIAPSSGANTVTFSGYTTSWSNVALAEVAGTQNVLDGTPASSSGTTSPGSLTTIHPNSVIFTAMDGFASATVWTDSSGAWSLTQSNGHDAIGLAYLYQPTAGTQNPTFSGVSTGSDTQAIFAFQIAAGATPPIITARVTRLGMEAMVAGTPQTRLTRLAMEAMVAGTPQTRLTRLAAEIMISNASAQQPIMQVIV